MIEKIGDTTLEMAKKANEPILIIRQFD